MQQIIALVGPSGIGKGSLKVALRNQWPQLDQLRWITTRPLRPEERENGDRIHISIGRFFLLVLARRISFLDRLGWHFYGVHRDEFMHHSGPILTEFRLPNLRKAQRRRWNVLAIGLVPNTTKLLADRLQRRATESTREQKRRLQIARREIEEMRRNEHLFSLFLTATPENESLIPARVMEFLLSHLGKE